MSSLPPLPGPLVSPKWLEQQLGSDGATPLVIADVRAAAGIGPQFDDYIERRIEGAVFIDLNADIADTKGDLTRTGRHPLPSPEHFASAMAARGICNDSVVVAYDATGGGIAATRLWFMLDAIGVSAAVLDGGLATWSGPTVSGQPDTVAPGHFAATPWPTHRFASADEVAVIATDSSTPLFDARSTERFEGAGAPGLDPQPGHIPGAVSAPWTNNLGPNGLFLDPASLGKRFEPSGDGVPVVYCGSGVTACHNLLALRIAGRDGRLYPGSWSQWASDPDRPVAK